MNKYIDIMGRRIGLDYKPLVIAEIGINHGGNLVVAKEMVDSAKRAGVEIVKHQTHIPHEEMSNLAKKAIPGNSTDSIWDIMSRCTLSEEQEFDLKQYIESKGMIFLSTPFSFAAVDRLEKFGVSAYKIGSGEMNNYGFVEYIASKKKPIILSTGMNDMDAVKKAVSTIKKHHDKFIVLHATNLYPTPSNLVRLGALEELKQEFAGEIIGLSDHTTNNLSCLAAVALGASVIERHFTDKKDRKGEDIICSMDELECNQLIMQSAEIARMRGGNKVPTIEENVTIKFAFSTLVSRKFLKKGTCISKDHIITQRPFIKGIKAEFLDDILGKNIVKDIKAGEHFTWEHFK